MPMVGQLVYSRAGRDRGRPLVVVAACDGRHVLVSDGRLRPGDRPKRKNVRHLDVRGARHAGLAAGLAVTDAELRRWIGAVAAEEPRGGSGEGQA